MCLLQSAGTRGDRRRSIGPADGTRRVPATECGDQGGSAAIAWVGGRHTACACYRVRGPGGIGGDRLGRRTAHGVCLLQSAGTWWDRRRSLGPADGTRRVPATECGDQVGSAAIAWVGGRHTACACYRVRGPGGIGGDRLGRRTAHGVCLLRRSADQLWRFDFITDADGTRRVPAAERSADQVSRVSISFLMRDHHE